MEPTEIHHVTLQQPILVGRVGDDVESTGLWQEMHRKAQECAAERGWTMTDFRLTKREPWTEPIGDMEPYLTFEGEGFEVFTFVATCRA